MTEADRRNEDETMELVDVLDENGRKTGRVKERSAVHHDGDWHRAVMVFVINGKQLLLQRRSLTKATGAGMLDLSYAGHVAADEDALTAAVREGREELGLMVKADGLLHIGEVKVQSRRPRSDKFGQLSIRNHFYDVYIWHTTAPAEKMILQKEEVSEVFYVSIGEFLRMVCEKNPELCAHPEVYGVFEEYLKMSGDFEGSVCEGRRLQNEQVE